MATVLVGCGWFDDKAPPSGEFYESSNAAELCQIDPEEISQILEKDISHQLWCIQANLEEFSRNVKIKNQNEIQQDELSNFVRSLFGTQSSGYIDGMIILFQVNTVLIQDENQKLVVKNLRQLFNSLIILNKMAVKLNLIFRDVNKSNFYKKRQALLKVTRELTQSLAKTIGTAGRSDRSLNIYELTDMLNEKLTTGTGNSEESQLVRIKSFFRIKSLLVGGQREILTAKEFRKLLPKFHLLAGVIFDLVSKPKDFFEAKEDELSHVQNVLQNLELIFDNSSKKDDVILTVTELKSIANEIGMDGIYNKYEDIIESFHVNLLGSNGDNITHRQIRETVVILRYLLPLFEIYFKFQPQFVDLKDESRANRMSILEDLQMSVEDWKVNSIELEQHPFFPKNLKVTEFIKSIQNNDTFESTDFQLIINILKLKQVFFGGEKDIWSKDDLFQLLSKSSDLLDISYVSAYLVDKFGETVNAKWDLLEQTILPKLELLIDNTVSSDQTLFSFEDIKNLASDFGFTEKLNHFLPLIDSFNLNVLNNDSENINEKTLRTSFVMLRFLMPLIKMVNDISPFPKDLKKQPRKIREALFLKIQNGLKQWQIRSTLYIDSPYFPENIQINNLLKDIASTQVGSDMKADLILDIMKVKTVFFGGDKESWDKSEFHQLMIKAHEMAKLSYTTMYFDDYYGNKLSDKWRILKENSIEMTELFFSDDINQTLLQFDELLDIVDTFQDKIITKDFLPSIELAWPRIFKHNRNEVTIGDAIFIFDRIAALMEELEFNHKTIEIHPHIMSETEVIKYVNYSRSDFYRQLGSANFYYLSHRFGNLVDKHKYFIDDTHKAIFDYDITRTTTGLTSFTSLRFIAEILMEAYGKVTSRNPIAIQMDREQVNTVLTEFKYVLKAFGLWTKKMDTFARNTILMADLFQDVSNGNMTLDLVEFIDYASMVLSALTMTNHTLENFHATCKNVGTSDDPEYVVSCYRPKFLETILNDYGYKKYLPNLARYIDDSPADEVHDFLLSTEKFARDTPDDSIPMGKRDFALLLGSLLSIESVMLKYDENRNNVIDKEELDKAFKLFESALVELAGLKEGGNEKYAKSIFLYLVKHQEIPSKFDLVVFHYNPFGKDITAKRKHIGGILYYLTKKNKP